MTASKKQTVFAVVEDRDNLTPFFNALSNLEEYQVDVFEWANIPEYLDAARMHAGKGNPVATICEQLVSAPKRNINGVGIAKELEGKVFQPTLTVVYAAGVQNNFSRNNAGRHDIATVTQHVADEDADVKIATRALDSFFLQHSR